MLKKIAAMLILTGLSWTAQGQEVGVLGGFHLTDADAKGSGVAVDSKVGFRLGVPIAFELVEGMKFRTGFIYTQRHLDVALAGPPATSLTAQFEYIDIPVLVQYQAHEMFGIFGGLTMALNMKKDLDPGGKASGTESIVPLVTIGATTLFNDMIGFDFYYERGIGKIADNAENFSTFGANFIYWIY